MFTLKKLNMLLLLNFFLFQSCNNDKADYDIAKQSNTANSYEEFIKKHPESKFVKNAIIRIDTLQYIASLSEGTINSYEKFINKNPNSKFLEIVKDKLDTLRYKSIELEDNLESYERFLISYPNSKFVYKIRYNLDSLRYLKVKSKNKIETYEEYITQFPNSRFKSVVQEHIQELYFNNLVKSSNSVNSIEMFLEKYPNNKFIAEANEKIKQIIGIISKQKIRSINDPDELNTGNADKPISSLKGKKYADMQAEEWDSKPSLIYLQLRLMQGTESGGYECISWFYVYKNFSQNALLMVIINSNGINDVGIKYMKENNNLQEWHKIDNWHIDCNNKKLLCNNHPQPMGMRMKAVIHNEEIRPIWCINAWSSSCYFDARNGTRIENSRIIDKYKKRNDLW